MSATPDFMNNAVPAKVEIDGEEILSNVSPELRGENNKHERPSDVRLLLKTAALDGRSYEFANHGHPDNELSKVTFDGNNAVVIMPAGDTPQKQLFSSKQILARMHARGLKYVTPEFIHCEIVKSTGVCRKFVGQIYGPAPFEAQAARFVNVDLPVAGGGKVTVPPEITDGYAQGMRAPTREEALLVLFAEKAQNLFLKGGDVAAAHISHIEESIAATMKGKGTALEMLDGFGIVAKGIVLAVDAADNTPKPIRLETAASIFDLAALSVVLVDHTGRITGEYQHIQHLKAEGPKAP